MQTGIAGRVALVTGGSRGIGRAIAVSLAQEAVNVVINFSANESAAEETVKQIVDAGGKASLMRFDVADPSACGDAVERIVKDQGGLQILVNNAGIALDGLILRYKDDDLDRIFRTNVFGAFYLARAAARPMMKARWGRMIMLGSVVGDMGNTGQAAYAATKSALEGMAKSLAREFASRNVTCNVVAPGFIDTDMTKASMTDEMRKSLISNIPAGAMGSATDIADAVTFLCSERARYITGQVLAVNGGLYM